MTTAEIERAAHLSALALFRVTLPSGAKLADRLELRIGKPVEAERTAGGWCFAAVKDQIERVLTREFVAKKPSKKRSQQ